MARHGHSRHISLYKVNFLKKCYNISFTSIKEGVAKSGAASRDVFQNVHNSPAINSPDVDVLKNVPTKDSDGGFCNTLFNNCFGKERLIPLFRRIP